MMLLRIDYETRLEKAQRLYEVHDEWSRKAINGDGRRTGGHVFPGLAVAHHLMAQGGKFAGWGLPTVWKRT